jgi:class 3 adenylate cyclase/tetratricopeptide (TPR) repeat protein
VTACPRCASQNPDGARFCNACGAELASPRRGQEQRKTVTVLFCDVTGSTALGEQLDPENLRRTMGRYFEEIRRIVERHGGTVEKFIGDAMMAVFGIPLAHEDDALRAVRAAAEIRERIRSLADELGVALSFRTGLNTGEVVAGEGETLITGDAVNVAARLEQAAPPGDVLIGAATLALVRDAVAVEAVEPLELKGKRDAVVAHRLVSVDPTAEAWARRHDAPLVGRVRERGRLVGDFEQAVAERACHLFTLLGPAGVGKSRLVEEFLADVGERAAVLRARCPHYGEDITYWPLVEILLAIGIEPESVIGTSPADTQLAFRKLLESRAAKRPQIVVLDDLQWAEELFLGLVEHVADWSRDAPILLLCIARPELLELRPAWGGGKLNATTVLLEPLSAGDCERLIDELAGDVAIDVDVRRRILTAADGNPLFLEEMLAMVAEGDGDEVVVPPTIQALLQARLDRLAAGERDIVGRGSVEGQVFHRAVVQELAPEVGRDGVAAHLASLVRKDLVRPEQATFVGDDAFRFRHLLIRDAAYDALPKLTRAELHERFAGWLVAHGGLVELDEVAGYHFEHAYRNRVALDSADARLAELGSRAAQHLAQAARGAQGRGDLGAARGLFRRAVALLPQGDDARLQILWELQWPLSEVGEHDEIRGAIAELGRSANRPFRLAADVLKAYLPISTGEFVAERAEEEVAALRKAMEQTGDELGRAWVELLSFLLSWSALRTEDARAAVLRGSTHAERAGQPALAGWFRSWDTAALVFGRTPAAEVIRLLEPTLQATTSPQARAGTLRALGRMHACRLEFDRGRELYREGVTLTREAGMLRQAAAASQGLAFIEICAGDLVAAETVLRDGIAVLETMHDAGFYPSCVCHLAGLLVRQGRDHEASTWVARACERIGPSDLDCVVRALGLEGLLAARRGEHAQGERQAREAVGMIAASDAYFVPGISWMFLAQTLIECGKPDDARAAAAEALALYEVKGDIPAANWARELLAPLEA